MSRIVFPLQTAAEDLLQSAYTYIKGKFASWVPNPANLDTALLISQATEAAELHTLAADVTDSIFRYFGATVIQIPPVDAAPAIGFTTWVVQDNAGYTIPAGTLVSIDATGSDRVGFTVLADVIIPPGTNTTTPGQVQIIAVDDGVAGNGLGGVGVQINLEDPLAFVTSVTLTAATMSGVDAEDDATYLARLRDDLTTISPRLILPNDFAVAARNVDTVWRALARDGYNPFHNLLSLNDASVETDITGWAALANCAIAQTAAQAADGIKSLQLTAAGIGDMDAESTLADAPAVSYGDTITGVAFFRTAVTARNVKVGLAWMDGGGALIGAIVYGATVADSNAGWVEASVTAQAPSGAAHVRLVVFVTAAVAAEVHYVDKMSIRRGTATDWVAGGTAETNNPRMIAVGVIDVAGAAESGLVKADVQTALDAQREVNFIVNVIDPTTQLIDVTFTVVHITGYDTVDLATRCEAAVSAFLDKSTWGVDPSQRDTAGGRSWILANVVRYDDIVWILRGVEGVDHISLLQIGLHGGAMGVVDLPLGGAAPLAATGTILGTAT